MRRVTSVLSPFLYNCRNSLQTGTIKNRAFLSILISAIAIELKMVGLSTENARDANKYLCIGDIPNKFESWLSIILNFKVVAHFQTIWFLPNCRTVYRKCTHGKSRSVQQQHSWLCPCLLIMYNSSPTFCRLTKTNFMRSLILTSSRISKLGDFRDIP